MPRTAFAQPTETKLLKDTWKWKECVCSSYNNQTVKAMCFKYGGEEYGIFKLSFTVPLSDEQKKKCAWTGATGLIKGRWTLFHIESGRLLFFVSEPEPKGMYNMLRNYVKVHFRGDKYLFSESVTIRWRKIQQNKQVKVKP